MLAILVYAGGIFAVSENRSVPEEFSAARIEGAKLAVEIVAASNHSLENLKKIADYDKQGNTSEALVLISQEVVKNQEMQKRAIALSSQLEKMAILIPQIEPTRARLIVTEALSAEVGLVSRLIVYQNTFFELFQVLRLKLEGGASDMDARIGELVSKINEEASAINNLNNKFTTNLAEFDRIFIR